MEAYSRVTIGCSNPDLQLNTNTNRSLLCSLPSSFDGANGDCKLRNSLGKMRSQRGFNRLKLIVIVIKSSTVTG